MVIHGSCCAGLYFCLFWPWPSDFKLLNLVQAYLCNCTWWTLNVWGMCSHGGGMHWPISDWHFILFCNQIKVFRWFSCTFTSLQKHVLNVPGIVLTFKVFKNSWWKLNLSACRYPSYKEAVSMLCVQLSIKDPQQSLCPYFCIESWWNSDL